MAYDSSFNYEDGDESFDTENFDLEITDLDQLWDYDDYYDDDLVEYEFHGTGDTGGTT
jgi:hypothetical protein